MRPLAHEIVLPDQPLIDGPTALRPWRDEDIAAIVRACQDPEIARWTRVPEHYGEVDAQAYLLERDASLRAGATAPFAIVASDDLGRLFGSVSILRLAWEHLRGEVGYWLAAEARGAGHATRAVSLACRWAFDALGLERIDLLAAAGNRFLAACCRTCGLHSRGAAPGAHPGPERTRGHGRVRPVCRRSPAAPGFGRLALSGTCRRWLEPLRDGHGRLIGDLRVSVTDRCNFRCQYCMPAEGLPWLER